MAREEHDREDLLRDATALVERASLEVVGTSEPLFVGFRRDGGPSFYFGPDRVYQFTHDGQLRRAFVDNRMLKAEAGRLVALDRRRTSTAVELVRHTLSPAEQQAFLADCRRHLDALGRALAGGHFRVVGQVPEHAEVVVRIQAFLAEHAGPMTISRSPRAR